MIELFPAGFEEIDRDGSTELVAYTDAGGEERVWHAFGGAHGADVEGGWEDRWRDFHKPVRVGRLWVGPPWETPPADALPIVIDPGRAFGTGAHPTTQLCLGLLLDLPVGSLLDIGCGSGVLSIAGAKLGFGPVVGIDTDAAAVEATNANATANGVEVSASAADGLSERLQPADVAVANIARAAIVALAPRVEAAMFVTSGYLVRDPAVLAGWTHVERRQHKGWAADLHRR